MIDRLEILASRIRYLVSRNRWSARLLGYRPVEGQRDQPGLVLVQIDGLGEAVLRRALAEGKMPFLRHLLDDEGFAVHPLYSGMASNTPNVQGELFYGKKTVVPGFGFVDRETGRELTMNAFSDTALIEERISSDGGGLLEGGSAWSDVFVGGAAESHLCASTSGVDQVLRALNPLRLLALVVWHGWSIVRVVANFLLEIGLAVSDFIRGAIAGRHLKAELRFIPERVVVTALMREIVTAGACIDAERGLSVIHLNFLGYDEHAHRRGPDSRFAVWTLRGIDRALRRIWLAAHRSPRRDYQFWVYSDHGQERVRGYRRERGEDVRDAVTREWRRLAEDAEASATAVPAAVPAGPGALLPEHDVPKSGRSRWLGFPERPAPAGRPAPAEVDEARPGPEPGVPHVIHRGPVGFVYLPEGSGDEVRDRFARRVADDAGVPMVLTRRGETGEEGGAWVWTPGSGRRGLPEDAEEILGEHPHRDRVARDLLRIVHHESAGELTLMGWNRWRAMSFKDENGAHGSAGPRETSAFFVLPPEMSVRIPRGAVLRPVELRELAREVLDPSRPHISLRARARERRLPCAPCLRLMTYNVHGCRGMDGRYSTPRIARVIARAHPDIVCLQELDQSRTRSGGANQVLEIARQLEKEYHFHAVEELDDGLFGNAVLSYHPMKLRGTGPLPRIDSRISLAERGVLWVEVDVDDVAVQVLNTHLSIHERERRLQVRALVDTWLRNPEVRGPVVLAGDFNTSADSYTARAIEDVLRNAVPHGSGLHRTWSSRVPVRRIDHVFTSGDLEVRSIVVPRSRLTKVASDHLPLVVDLSGRPSGDGRPASTG